MDLGWNIMFIQFIGIFEAGIVPDRQTKVAA